MSRIEGTDFYYRSMSLEPTSIYTYRLTVWDEGMPDPLNAKRTGPEGNETSIVTTGGFEEPTFLEEAKEKGNIEEYTWKSEILDNERTVNFYLPPGYADSEDRYPVLVVNHGNQALGLAKMNNTLDNLIAEGRIEPVIAAFVPRVVWAEYGGSHPDRYVEALAEELLPYMDRTFRTHREKDNTGIMGVGSAGFAALYAAFSAPDTFGMAASQSFYWCEKKDELIEAIKSSEADGRMFYIERSKRDYYTEASGLDARADSEQIAGLLEEQGFEVETNLTGNVPDWVGWAVTADGILEAMYASE
ncbi:MAG: alpha/beta hydrolase-fold protein [Acidobacteriota bacterium]